jgi:hypothetical protein
MKKAIYTNVMLIAAGLMLFAGCMTEEPATTTETNADVPQQPPVQAEVVPPQPDMTFIWTPGYWDWQDTWVWVHGFWGPRPHPGAIWVRGGWVMRGDHRVWVHPHWR